MEQLLTTLLPLLLQQLQGQNPQQIADLVTQLANAAKIFFPQVPASVAVDAAASVANRRATRWWQLTLNLAGASPQLTVDGVYGQMTKDAVSEYQKKRGLVVDGWVGDETDRDMRTWLAAKVQPPAGLT